MRRHIVLSLMFLVTTASWQAFATQRTADSAVQEGSNYTLVGRLVRNQADRDGANPYVLLDQSGRLRGYLSPASGVGLQPYVGQRVELEGVADSVAGARGNHFTIGRIVAAERPVKTGAYRAAPQKTAGQGVRQAAYQDASQGVKSIAAGESPKKDDTRSVIVSPRPEGSVVEGNPAVPPDAGPFTDEGPGPGGCSNGSCGMGDDCGAACGRCGPCFPRLLPRGGVYADIDYLLWWTEGMHVPALVTSGPTADQPGYIGYTGTTILFGDSSLMTSDRSGGRLRVGTWLNCCQTIGVEGEYLAVSDGSVLFRMWSDGDPIISRPFTDVTRPTNDPENVEKVAFPRGNAGSLDGAVNIEALSKFQAAGVRLRLNLCGMPACCPDPCTTVCHTDFLIGYRFLRLDDALVITEQLTSTDPTALGAFLIQDQFSTRSQFHGCELGFDFQRQRGCWSLNVVPKIAMGNTNESADVFGFTRTTNPDGSRTLAGGGLLALSSNIGQYTHNEFAVVPELDLTAGYQLTSHLRATLGYTFIYWSRVARAGDQIDVKVNPTLIPGAGAATGDTSHPAFTFQQTDFWAQGLNFGLDYRW